MTIETTSGHVRASLSDGVLHICLDRADKHNALNEAMYADLLRAVQAGSTDDAVRVLMFTGEGRSFCAGNDLADFFRATSGKVGGAVPFIAALMACPKVVIAGIQGNAVGIGTTMLLHMDMVVAADDARLITPFVDLGAVPEAGSAKLLPAWMGYHQAARMLLLGEPLPADEAYRCGLLSSVVPLDELQNAVTSMAKSLAAKPPKALMASKRLMRGAIHRPLDELVDEDMALFGEMLMGEESRAAIAAKLKK